MNEPKKESFSPPAVGGSSLLTVFAVLALTVFALLALSTVKADVRLADASAKAVEDYYAADCKAQEILARLRNGGTPEEVEVTALAEESGGVAYTYAVPISDTQQLQVEVLVDGEEYQVRCWQAAPSGEWAGSDNVFVWDGE